MQTALPRALTMDATEAGAMAAFVSVSTGTSRTWGAHSMRIIKGVFPHGGEQGWGRDAFVRDAAMVAPEIAHGVGAGAR